MYLRLSIALTGPRTLFWRAVDPNRPEWPPDDGERGWFTRRCALCGAHEYPMWFEYPHPWPRLHQVATSLAMVNNEGIFAVLPNDSGDALYLPIEDAEDIMGPIRGEISFYRICRYHGRPETSGWIDCYTNCLIEWIPEPPPHILALHNMATALFFGLRVALRFIKHLICDTIAIRLEVKRHLPW